MTKIYPGYVPSNVSKDAKYSVRRGANGEFEIQLQYRTTERERFLLANDAHGQLVEMVNAVKAAVVGAEGGAFYINEFGDVIVPTNSGAYFAGFYDRVLEFDLEGASVSPRAPDDLEPGDLWPGPRVGVRYTLMASGVDIKYELKSGRRQTEVRLSDDVGDEEASALARRLTTIRGASGRIYINECGEFFSPPSDGGIDHRYLGSLGEDPWFTPVDLPGRP